MDQRTKGRGVTGRERLLAIEVRSRRFGFVVMEGTMRTLDFGVRICPSGREPVPGILTGKASKLMYRYCPHRVVVREVSRRAGAAASVAGIRAEARRRSIPVGLMPSDAVESFFRNRGYATKHEVALVLAEWFRELTWKLPAKRRPWDNEPHNAIMFDAVALAVAFLATHEAGPFDGPSADE